MVAEHRSIHPHLAGVPWWAAILIAATTTAIGFAFDAGAGNKELTHVFAALYVLGCVAAVLMVQQSGVFTAVIQPPLILFGSVPGAYWLFHGGTFNGVKNILINCGYPLIERFPLMLFTSAAVLLIGMVRWYLGLAAQRDATPAAKDGATSAAGALAEIAAAVASFWHRQAGRPGGDRDDQGARRRQTGERRPARGAASASRTRATKRTAPTRSRHIRPPLDDAPEPPAERPRRRRPEYARNDESAPEPRRRPREPRDPARRGQPPRDGRRDPHLRKGGPTRPSRVESYEPVEPPEPRRRRQPAPNGTSSTHHPISRVRYRGGPSSDEPRPRGPRNSEPESWQYDI